MACDETGHLVFGRVTGDGGISVKEQFCCAFLCKLAPAFLVSAEGEENG